MPKFKVNTPVEGLTETIVGIPFRDGEATVDTEIDAHRRALQYFQQQGYLVPPLDEDGDVDRELADERGREPRFGPDAGPGGPITPTTVFGEPSSDNADADPNPPVDAPSRSASKAVWLDYATSDKAGDRRLDQVDADPMTRDQLATHVLGDPNGGAL